MSGYMNGRSLAPHELHLDHHHHQQQQQQQQQQQYYSSRGASSNNSINNQKVQSNNSSSGEEEDDELGMMIDLRRGPWTVEEDHTLMSYIAKHGEGRWNTLARCAGLKRTGKSCRLRWLNYLRPDVRRGNITLEEQLLILELHSRWGNRWSKIAQHLPGRTDNEIKNYWRTRVQKHAKQLKCDVNSKQFKDTMRYLWIPRLVERIQAAAAAAAASGLQSTQTSTTHQIFPNHHDMIIPSTISTTYFPSYVYSENSSTTVGSSDSCNAQVSPVSDLIKTYQNLGSYSYFPGCSGQTGYMDSLVSQEGYYHPQSADFQTMEQNKNSNNNNNVNQWTVEGGDVSDNMWNVEDIWFLQQQQFNNNCFN